MEELQSNGKSPRHWRKTVKKLQRKQRRQKAAKERDKILEEVEAAKLRDPVYQEFQQQHAQLEEHLRETEERQRQFEEEAWLRRELLVQRHFRAEQKRRAAEEAKIQEIQATELAKLQKEREKQKRLDAEKQRCADETAAEFERTMQRMQDYLTEEQHQEQEINVSPPAELQRIVESRPGQKKCEFYERTNCCRYGPLCVFNHCRPLLSRIIVVRHFFTHALLQPTEHQEYAGADAALEMNERDLRDDYDAFFEDVVPEMERYGALINFRTIRNVQAHLRGHVFVEYADKRSALKAFIGLQGRFYATRRLNVEFSNLPRWRGAICGLSVTRKCPKAQNCNYLHVFSNPKNKYNTALEYTQTSTYSARKVSPSNTTIATPLLSWDDIGKPKESESRNWRWSASPEPMEKSTENNSISCSNNTESSKHMYVKHSQSSRLSKHSLGSKSRESDSKTNRDNSRTRSYSRDSIHKSTRRKDRSRSRSRSKSRESDYKSTRHKNRSRSHSRSESRESDYKSSRHKDQNKSHSRSKSRQSDYKNSCHKDQSRSCSRSKSRESDYNDQRIRRSNSKSLESNYKSNCHKDHSISRSKSSAWRTSDFHSNS